MYSSCGDQGLFSLQCVHKFYPECILWAESQGLHIAGRKAAARWEDFILTPHVTLNWCTSNWSAESLLHPFQLCHAQIYWHISEEAYAMPRYSSPKGHQRVCQMHHNAKFLLELPAASLPKTQLLQAKLPVTFWLFIPVAFTAANPVPYLSKEKLWKPLTQAEFESAASSVYYLEWFEPLRL